MNYTGDMMDGILDLFFSDKPLGCVVECGKTVFRLFAPRAYQVHLVLFEKQTDRAGMESMMTRDSNGIWEIALDETCSGSYYGYRIWGPNDQTEIFNPDIVVADPYSKAVSVQNHYLHSAKSMIRPPLDFDWEDDQWICPDLENLIVYEMHVRDMTAHPSSGITPENRGRFLGLAETGKIGGLDYIRSLGVNAVELLPVQEFGNMEVDYRNSFLPIYNDWNPYARNHWGYMTSYFFAPESYYASGGNLDADQYCGQDGRQIVEFKQMVKAFHQAGIAVLMDVVYNHVSHYDLNPLKYIDKKYYFRLDNKGVFLKTSGCGNDFKTERPMARRLIVDSLLYWMKEYHIDGFRFDLAAMLDDQTLDEISSKTRELNPRVILIAEPWGGGKYGQSGFSNRGWASWNDLFRNGVKGQNPIDGLGFIFGKGRDDQPARKMKSFVRGTLAVDGGPFVRAGHSVNYLESHDDYTFGDFVRIGSGRLRADQMIVDIDSNARLSEIELKIHKLGALFLLTSQGAVMLHEGQEFGRSKVIAKTDVPDFMVGRMDHNSYNKDNETNWINYDHAATNTDLVDYYRGLIRLRRSFPVFRHAKPDEIRFLEWTHLSGIGYQLHHSESESPETLVVLMNGHGYQEAEFHLPENNWSVLVDGQRSGTAVIRTIQADRVRVPPTTGMVLLRGSKPSLPLKQMD